MSVVFRATDHVRTKTALVGERMDADFAIEQRRCDRILKAELSFQPHARLRTVGIQDLGRDDADLTDAGRSADSRPEVERGRDPKVRWVFGRIEFDRHSRVDAAVRPAEIEQHVVIKMRRKECRDISVRRFENGGVSGETAPQAMQLRDPPPRRCRSACISPSNRYWRELRRSATRPCPERWQALRIKRSRRAAATADPMTPMTPGYEMAASRARAWRPRAAGPEFRSLWRTRR